MIIPSLITDYIGSRNKEIEEQIYTIFKLDSIPQIRTVERLFFTIFKEVPVWMGNARHPFSIRKYTISTNEGEILIDNSLCAFRGGIHVSAKNICFLIKFRTIFIRINLSLQIEQRLLAYIQNGLPEPKFCCFDFARYLTGKYILKSIKPPRPFNEEWTVSPVFSGEEQLQPGDFVSLCVHDPNSPSKLKLSQKHHAFYLGSKLYLSVNGDGGDLVVMGLDEMISLWKAPYVVLIIPKPPC